jgi:hypothetical protein
VAKRIEDRNQMDLFGGALEPSRPPSALPPSSRPPRRRPAAAVEAPPSDEASLKEEAPAKPEAPPLPASPPPAPPREATLASLVAAATDPELDDFVSGLDDEQLSFLAIATVRELRQRIERPKRRSGPGTSAAPQTLRRALRRLAEELGGDG